jgi:membrane dipeptidase
MNLPLFDAHCDTLWAMQTLDQPLWRNGLHLDLERGRKYLPRAQFFAMFGGAFPAQYQLFQRALRANRAHLAFCRTATEARGAERAGKTAAFLSVEGAELLDCSPDRLTEAATLGVRMLTLTWNGENALSGTHCEAPDRGLTDLGRKFVRRCRDLGVIVDVSHLSEPGFWDVVEETAGPFVASHSNSATVWPHSRNLTDAQFLAIVKAKGVAGINLYSAFLGADPDVDDAIAHMEHFLGLGGEKSVAIGADLDGCERLPRGIAGIEDLEKLAEGLLRRNYSEQIVSDIFYHNLFRVVEDICGI